MSLERRTGVVTQNIEEIIDDLKDVARLYGGRVKVITHLNSKFVGSEVILPRTVGQEYIPSTNVEKMETLPHVSSLWGYSALLRRVGDVQRLTIKESVAFDVDDEDDEEAGRRTLNAASFYKLAWGPEGVIEAMKRESRSIDTRPHGYQKVVDRSIDSEGVDVRTLRVMDTASNEGGLDEHAVLVDREVDLIELRRRIALYAGFLAESHEGELILGDMLSESLAAEFMALFGREI